MDKGGDLGRGWACSAGGRGQLCCWGVGECQVWAEARLWQRQELLHRHLNAESTGHQRSRGRGLLDQLLRIRGACHAPAPFGHVTPPSFPCTRPVLSRDTPCRACPSSRYVDRAISCWRASAANHDPRLGERMGSGGHEGGRWRTGLAARRLGGRRGNQMADPKRKSRLQVPIEDEIRISHQDSHRRQRRRACLRRERRRAGGRACGLDLGPDVSSVIGDFELGAVHQHVRHRRHLRRKEGWERSILRSRVYP
eukprot:scaffold785_cov85-Isochrysis_galbana.AAC.2